MNFIQLVMYSVKQNASDLHLCVGSAPILRIDGQLVRMDVPPLNAQQIASGLLATLNEQQTALLQQAGEVDYVFELNSGERLRGHLFYQRLGLSAAYRHIACSPPTADQLALPPVIEHILQYKDGLFLVTGATGSGKSSTLAALIDTFNQRLSRHIITLEQPIEFLHRNQGCLIQQREVGQHSHSFATALRAALRQDPDILLIGELRDPETIRLALTAAETGHLVLASLHTRSAIQTVDRLVDVFPAEEKPFVRALLAGSLRGVIAQQLYAKRGGGRVAVFEILLATPAVSHLIREGKSHQLLTLLQTGKAQGMQTLEQGIRQRIQEGVLATAEVA